MGKSVINRVLFVFVVIAMSTANATGNGNGTNGNGNCNNGNNGNNGNGGNGATVTHVHIHHNDVVNGGGAAGQGGAGKKGMRYRHDQGRLFHRRSHLDRYRNSNSHRRDDRMFCKFLWRRYDAALCCQFQVGQRNKTNEL